MQDFTKIAQKIIADYIHDPEHKKRPEANGNWYKTQRGWSNVKPNSLKDNQKHPSKTETPQKNKAKPSTTKPEKKVLRQKIKDKINDQIKSPEFKNWFGGSKVTNPDGSPKILYHGTTHNFSSFTKDRGNIENWLGLGFYFSSDPLDVSENYAGEGPDLQNRIEQETENIQREWEDDRDEFIYHYKLDQKDVEELDSLGDTYYDSDIFKNLARKKLSGGTPNIMPVYLKMENPIYIGTKNNTKLFIESDTEYYLEEAKDLISRDDYDSDEEYNDALQNKATDLYYEDYDPKEDGTAVGLKNAITEVFHREGIDGDYDLIQELQEGTDAQSFDKKLREHEDLAVHSNEDGQNDSFELIREIYEKAGFDGVVMDADKYFGNNREMGQKMKMNKGTEHYVAFNPTQIKSAIGNSGKFDPNNPEITASPESDTITQDLFKIAGMLAQPLRNQPDYGKGNSLLDQLANRAGLDLDELQENGIKTAMEFNTDSQNVGYLTYPDQSEWIDQALSELDTNNFKTAKTEDVDIETIRKARLDIQTRDDKESSLFQLAGKDRD